MLCIVELYVSFTHNCQEHFILEILKYMGESMIIKSKQSTVINFAIRWR